MRKIENVQANTLKVPVWMTEIFLRSNQAHLLQDLDHGPDEDNDQGDDVNLRGGFDGRAGHGGVCLVPEGDFAKANQAMGDDTPAILRGFEAHVLGRSSAMFLKRGRF
jgi:hypothetical protein